MYEIVDPSTSQHHHWCLKISSIDRTKTKGWTFKPEKSVSLDDDGSQELRVLAEIITRAQAGQLAGRDGAYHLVPASEMQGIKALLRAAKSADSEQRMRVVRAVLENLDVNSVPPADWLRIFAAGNDAVRRAIAISARLVEYKRVRDELETLIAQGEVAESKLQKLLTNTARLSI